MRQVRSKSEQAQQEQDTFQPSGPNCRPLSAYLGVKMLVDKEKPDIDGQIEEARAMLAEVCGEISFRLDGVKIGVSDDIAGTLGKERFPEGVEIPKMCDTALQINVTPTYDTTGHTPGNMLVAVNRQLWTALQPLGLRIATPFAHLRKNKLEECYAHNVRARTESIIHLSATKFLDALGGLQYQQERRDDEQTTDFRFDEATIFRGEGKYFEVNLARRDDGYKFDKQANSAIHNVHQYDSDIPPIRFMERDQESRFSHH